MNELIYPSIGFIKKGKALINRDLSFSISFAKEKDALLAIEARQFLIAGSMPAVVSGRVIFQLFLKLPRFAVMCFYAQGAGYKIILENNDFIFLSERSISTSMVDGKT